MAGSNNVGIFCDQAVSISEALGINADYWRFYLLKIRPESHDSSFDWTEFISVCNSDLVNNIGNYINRCVSMSNKYLEGITTYIPNDYVIKTLEYMKEYNQNLDDFKFIKGIIQCINLGTYGNKYLQTEKPWTLAKNLEKNKSKIDNILGSANMIAYILITMLIPIIPGTAIKLIKLFNFKKSYVKFDKLLNNKNIITLDNTGYELPFKTLEKDVVKETLAKLKIKSSL